MVGSTTIVNICTIVQQHSIQNNLGYRIYRGHCMAWRLVVVPYQRAMCGTSACMYPIRIEKSVDKRAFTNYLYRLRL